MVLHLSRKRYVQLLKWAEDAGQVECCGLLLGQSEMVTDVVHAANISADADHHFEIDPATLIAAHKEARNGGPQIIGYFHSHPNGLARPSRADIAQAANDGRYWLIIANQSISAWQPRSDGDQVVAFDAVQLVVEG
jgi:proteasome lid subunit RPN8/RPN11